MGCWGALGAGACGARSTAEEGGGRGGVHGGIGVLAAPNTGWLEQRCARGHSLFLCRIAAHARVALFAQCIFFLHQRHQQHHHHRHNNSHINHNTVPRLPLSSPFCLDPGPPLLLRLPTRVLSEISNTATLERAPLCTWSFPPFLIFACTMVGSARTPPVFCCVLFRCALLFCSACVDVWLGVRGSWDLYWASSSRAVKPHAQSHTRTAAHQHTRRETAHTHTQGRLRFAQPSS